MREIDLMAALKKSLALDSLIEDVAQGRTDSRQALRKCVREVAQEAYVAGRIDQQAEEWSSRA